MPGRYTYRGMRTDAEPVESGLKPAKNRKTFGKSYHNSVAASPFTIGIIQDHATDDTAANLARAERLVRDAAQKGAQIICLKELLNATYFCKAQQCDRFDLAEPIPGPTTDRMQAIARELEEIGRASCRERV